MKNYLALDVGGTEIKRFLLREDGKILEGPKIFEANSQESREYLLAHFRHILQDGIESTPSIQGIGIAFPGPFDYEHGISLIQGIGKYDSLYGVNLRTELASYFPGIPLRFANDADLFGLGEYAFGSGKNYERVFYLCIGTGVGSCFVERGKLIKQRPDVPTDGWVFREPFQDGIIDEILSAGGIMRIASKIPSLNEFSSVKALANTAISGNAAARTVFHQYGILLQEGIFPFALRFSAQQIVIGGQVSRSFSLFSAELEQACKENGISLAYCPESMQYAAKGIITLFQ